MNKNIAIIFGGTSPEYNVSLNSAFSVITNLDNYNLYKIAIAPNGSFYLFEGDNRLIPEDKWQNYTKTLSVNLSENCFICDGKKIKIDLIIPMIHGESGEDGSIQALGKIMNIKVLGSGILSSALCLDKYRSHLLAQSINIKTANSILLKKGDQVDIGHLKYPLFIKPVHAGSSYGISKVYKEEELKVAIDEAYKYDNEIIIEEYIDGFEIGCSIIGNKELFVGEIDEIEVNADFFDYEEKYQLTHSAIHLPARINSELKEKAIETAVKLYRIFDLKDYARIDLFVDRNNQIFFNEINTIPGFTEHSRFPKMMKAKGLNMKNLLRRMIEEELC